MQARTAESCIFSTGSRDFLNSLRASRRAGSTLESYAKKLKSLEKLMGNIFLQQITSNELIRAVISLEQGYPGVRPRSGTSMNQIRSVVRTFFYWARETGRILINPVVDLRLAKAVSQRTLPISEEELSILFRTIRRDGSLTARRDETFFYFICLFWAAPE
jgi:site-specific recombinase XerD